MFKHCQGHTWWWWWFCRVINSNVAFPWVTWTSNSSYWDPGFHWTQTITMKDNNYGASGRLNNVREREPSGSFIDSQLARPSFAYDIILFSCAHKYCYKKSAALILRKFISLGLLIPWVILATSINIWWDVITGVSCEDAFAWDQCLNCLGG